MRNDVCRTPTSRLSNEELKLTDELTMILVRMNSPEDRFSLADLAYILGVVLPPKDIQLLKEIL